MILPSASCLPSPCRLGSYFSAREIANSVSPGGIRARLRCGDPVNRKTLAFGSVVAGMAADCLSEIENVDPSLGGNELIDCFMVKKHGLGAERVD